MSSSWAKVRSVNVLAFLCGWVGGLRDLDDALQEDGLFAREVRLGDWGGSSMPCRRTDCSPERFASETGAVPPCPAGGRTVRPRGSPRRLGRFLHALQEDGLFAREVRLGDWGGSSTVCSHSGDGLRESLDLMTCVPFPLFLPAFSFLFFPPILMSIVMNVKGMHHAVTFTTAMSRSQITAPSFKEKIMGRRQRGVDAVRAPCACGDRS